MAAWSSPKSDSPSASRATAFGDGVFETVLVRQGRPLLWQAHYDRLALGCKTLGLQIPEAALRLEALENTVALATQPWAVLKIIVWRARVARGYTPFTNATELSIELEPINNPVNGFWQNGVAAEVCEQRLAVNPQLAGIKHLNRLEQVMARDELYNRRVAEGLLLDTSGNLIEGSMSNLFLVTSGKLSTPQLTGAGVAGIMRGAIADQFGAEVRRLTLNDFYRAEEAFVCNSVIGVWPLRQLGCHMKPVGPLTSKVQNWIKKALYA